VGTLRSSKPKKDTLKLPKPTKNYYEAGFGQLGSKTKQKVTNRSQILSQLNSEYGDALEIIDIKEAPAVEEFDGTVYSAVTTIYFDQAYKVPPIAICFSTSKSLVIGEEDVVTSSASLPAMSLEFYEMLLVFADGFVCTEWTTAEIFTDRVVITAYSIYGINEDYLVFILKDKSGKRIN
jgi:hypothetical protein